MESNENRSNAELTALENPVTTPSIEPGSQTSLVSEDENPLVELHENLHEATESDPLNPVSENIENRDADLLAEDNENQDHDLIAEMDQNEVDNLEDEVKEDENPVTLENGNPNWKCLIARKWGRNRHGDQRRSL
ncbi:hypothetical protein TNIN_444741 [Trichonephila inaurata madagascariensis]|uniref:Uncharacterized protein n=1 Tax=Trichonephila inaurata madagascariensis TaxID=2747483 RepID=A0A8X7CR52_9ARAC|nr:hypothetical protein TNIN_444741 [Trichonephila inaurata madagascariensis]